MADSLAELQDALDAFVEERDWAQFHTPKNLAMGVAIEAAEIMEHFQWCTGGRVVLAAEGKARRGRQRDRRRADVPAAASGARWTSTSSPPRGTSSCSIAKSIRSRRRRGARRSTSISTDRLDPIGPNGAAAPGVGQGRSRSKSGRISVAKSRPSAHGPDRICATARRKERSSNEGHSWLSFMALLAGIGWAAETRPPRNPHPRRSTWHRCTRAWPRRPTSGT